MAQPVTICNNSLADIGLQPITSFEDGTTRAHLCRDKFPAARDAVLSNHPWNFATTYRTLQAMPTEIQLTTHWTYQYLLPSDPYCLHVFEAGTDSEFEIISDPVHGRLLMANAGPPLTIKFAWRKEDTAAWSPLAVKTLEKWLAADLASLSTSPKANRDTLLKEALTLMGQAQIADAREGKPIVLAGNMTLVYARSRGGWRRW